MKQELVDFIISRTHLRAEEIRPELRLSQDIGLVGLDSVMFFEEFFENFQIKNIEGFDADLHIEGSVDFAPRPLHWIKNILIKERRKYLRPDVTMGHLDKVLESGKWFNER